MIECTSVAVFCILAACIFVLSALVRHKTVGIGGGVGNQKHINKHKQIMVNEALIPTINRQLNCHTQYIMKLQGGSLNCFP